MSAAGVATFQAALAELFDAKPVDARTKINGAVEALSAAVSDINRISREKLINIGPLTGEKGKAVFDLWRPSSAGPTPRSSTRMRTAVADLATLQAGSRSPAG